MDKIKTFDDACRNNPIVHAGVTMGISDRDIIVALAEHIRQFQEEIYRAMGLPWDIAQGGPEKPYIVQLCEDRNEHRQG